MSTVNKMIESVRVNITSALSKSTLGEKVNIYNSWAETYDEDVAALLYRAPSLAANMISSHFKGDLETAVVLDLACGTGLVAKQLTTHGFRHFVGVDGSEGMLELARKTGLYQELKQCLMGEVPLPVQWGSFDVVVIVGALSSYTPIALHVVREMCKSAKLGGYICMTTRDACDNTEYKAALERELKQMEDEGLWSRVEVNHVKNWEMGVLEKEPGYISGVVYLYKKL